MPEMKSDSYRRYKQDTDDFITWIVSTGESCEPKGYTHKPAQLRSRVPTGTATGRSKGKKRKQAAKKNATLSRDHVKTVKCTLKIRDIIRYVEIISNSSNAPALPRNVQQSASRAVSARQRCTQRFKSIRGDPKGNEMDQSHECFNTVLAAALRDLSVPVEANVNSVSLAEPNASLGQVANRFSELEVEEPSDLLAEYSTAVYDVPASATKHITYQVQGVSHWQEIQFMGFCLFEDMHRVQHYIKALWKDYKDERVDLVTATLVTNAAIDQVQQMEEAIKLAFPDLIEASSYVVLTEVMRTACEPEGDCCPAQSAATGLCKELTEMDHFLYAATADTVLTVGRVLQDSIDPRPVPMPSARLDFIRRPELLMLPLYKQLEVDHERLVTMLLEVKLKMTLKMTIKDLGGIDHDPTHDGFTKAAQFSVASDGICGAWSIFACRLMLDIQDCLGDEMNKAWDHLQVKSKEYQENLDPAEVLGYVPQRLALLIKDAQEPLLGGLKMDVFQKYTVSSVNVDAKAMPQKVQELVCGKLIRQGINPDPFVSTRAKSIMDNRLGPDLRRVLDAISDVPADDARATMDELRVFDMIPPAEDPIYSYTHNPLACGTLLFDLELGLEDVYLTFGNQNRSIIPMAHLHNALKNNNMLDMPFPDLERVIDKISGYVFGSERPRTCEASFRMLALKMGMSLSLFARNARAPPKYPTVNRRVNETSYHKLNPLASAFRAAEANEVVGKTLSNLEKVMRNAGTKPLDSSIKERKISALRPFSRSQFLEQLSLNVAPMREDMLGVNLISLTLQCNEILSEVRERIAEEQGIRYPGTNPSEEKGHRFLPMACNILNDAATHEKAQMARARPQDRQYVAKGGPQLWIVAEVLEEHLTD